MARGGRGGRGGRAGSSEPTRSSRRLRSSQEPEDVAPLLEGLPPVKKGRGRPKKTETITEETESYEDAPATSFDTQTTTSSIDPAEYTSSPHEAPPTSETDPAITVEKKTTEIITNDDKEVDEEPTEAPHATIESDEATGPYNDLYNGEHQSSSVFAEREQKQCNEQRERPRQPRRKSRKLLLQLPPTPSPPPKRVPPVTEPASTEAALRGMEEAIRQAELQEARKREELKKKKEAELARYLQEEHNRAIHGYDSEEDSLDGDIVPFRCKAKTLVPMTGDLVAAKMADGAFLGRSISGSDDRDNLFAYTTLPRDSVDALELLFFNQPNSNLLSLVQTLDDATITAFMTARLRTRHSQTRDHDDLNRVKHHMLEFATHYITDMGVARRLLVNTRLQLEQHAERNRELEMMHEKDQEAIEAMQRELASGKQQPGIRPVMKGE